MSESSQSNNELDRLLSHLADGTLAPASLERLAELLAADPVARASYYEHMMLEALLRREGRRSAEQIRDASTHQVAAPPTLAAAGSGRVRPWLLVLAASLLLGVILSVGEATGVTRLVPTIIRIATGEGTLLIEIDDPGVSVTLDGQDIKITGAGVHELRLRPGTHNFTASRDGQPVGENVITIEHGGRQVVKITREGAIVDLGEEGQVSTAAGGSKPLGDSIHSFVHSEPAHSVAFVGDGRRVFSGGFDHTARLWNVEAGAEVHCFDFHEEGKNHAIYSVAASPDGHLGLVGSRQGRVWLVDLAELRVLKHCDHAPKARGLGITSVAFSADGRQALLGSYDGAIRVWNIDEWQEQSRLNHTPGLWSVDFSPDQQHVIAAGGLAGEVAVSFWGLGEPEPLRRFDAGDGRAAGFWRSVLSPDGTLVAAACHDGRVYLWNLESGKLVRQLTHPQAVASACFTPDGKRLLSGGYDGILRLWDIEAGAQLQSYRGHGGVVQCVAVSADGKHAASASHDKTVRVWQLPP